MFVDGEDFYPYYPVLGKPASAWFKATPPEIYLTVEDGTSVRADCYFGKSWDEVKDICRDKNARYRDLVLSYSRLPTKPRVTNHNHHRTASIGIAVAAGVRHPTRRN
jgi:hypothetical protein